MKRPASAVMGERATVNRVLLASFTRSDSNEQTVMSCDQLKMLVEDNTREDSVDKIMLYTKKGKLEAMIQLAKYEDAATMMAALHEAEVDLEDQTCLLRLSYTTNRELHVIDEKHGKDYRTGWGLGICPRETKMLPLPQSQQRQQVQPKTLAELLSTLPPKQKPVEQGREKVVAVADLRREVTSEALARLFGICGKVRAVLLTARQNKALIEYHYTGAAARAEKQLHNVPLYGLKMDVRVTSLREACKVGSKNEGEATLFLTENDPSHRTPDCFYPPSTTVCIKKVPLTQDKSLLEGIIKQFQSWRPFKINWVASPVFYTLTLTLDSLNTATALVAGLHSVDFDGTHPGGLSASFSSPDDPFITTLKGQVIYDPTTMLKPRPILKAENII